MPSFRGEYWSNNGQITVERARRCRPSALNIGQIMVKYRSNNGQTLVKFWLNTGQIMTVKYRSNTGQLLVKYRFTPGWRRRRVVKYW
jgi:hypothetical protein